MSKRDARFVTHWEPMHNKGPRSFILKGLALFVLMLLVRIYWRLVPHLTFKLMGMEEFVISPKQWRLMSKGALIAVWGLPFVLLVLWIAWRLGERRWRRLMGSA